MGRSRKRTNFKIIFFIKGDTIILPIIYPQDYQGQSLDLIHWSETNAVVPSGSGVVILDEGENYYKLVIPKARLNFEISSKFAKIVK